MTKVIGLLWENDPFGVHLCMYEVDNPEAIVSPEMQSNTKIKSSLFVNLKLVELSVYKNISPDFIFTTTNSFLQQT